MSRSELPGEPCAANVAGATSCADWQGPRKKALCGACAVDVSCEMTHRASHTRGCSQKAVLDAAASRSGADPRHHGAQEGNAPACGIRVRRGRRRAGAASRRGRRRRRATANSVGDGGDDGLPMLGQLLRRRHMQRGVPGAVQARREVVRQVQRAHRACATSAHDATSAPRPRPAGAIRHRSRVGKCERTILHGDGT